MATDIKKLALRDPVGWLAFGFGSGLAPWAPGTFGTLMALPFYLLLSLAPLWLYAALVVLAFIAGVWICEYACRQCGTHDHGGIVWDEFVGLWIALFALPVEWPWMLAGFALFRFFDIIKPWPIRWADQRVHGGLGVMLDDVIAGLYSAALLHLALAALARI